MDKIEFIERTDSDTEDKITRARIVECGLDETPTFGELSLALGIFQRAMHTNRTMAIEILRKQDLFKAAVIGYQPVE
jgi:hypothetical protein